MKYISLCFLIMLFSCADKNALHPELEKAIQQYQSQIPIPELTNLKNYVFIYEVDFSLKDKDTIIHIVRRPSGIPENSECYGVYDLGNQKPVVIYDENNLAGEFLENKVKNEILHKYEVSAKKKHYVDYPPVYSYKVSGLKINLLKIDTISDNWKR